MDYRKIKCAAFLEFHNKSGLLVLETITWTSSLHSRSIPYPAVVIGLVRMDHPFQRSQSSCKSPTQSINQSGYFDTLSYSSFVPRQCLSISPIPYLPIPRSPIPCSPIPFSPIPCSPIPYSPIPCAPIPYSPILYSPILCSPIPYPPIQYLPKPCSSFAANQTPNN